MSCGLETSSESTMYSFDKIKAIAFYLPQYHPIPENDAWWGKGFTEWTNVTKAKPLFPGHYQPNLPSNLGFYDLRVPETRIAQAELAKAYGIAGFCYWHYWFGNGRRLLERPFTEVLETGEPDFPFCLGWANHTWTGIWDGCPDRILIQQTYPGRSDYEAHFKSLLIAFKDNRYMKVEGKPIFTIFRPEEIPDTVGFTNYWRQLADQSGLPGMYFIGLSNNLNWNPLSWGFDAFSTHSPLDITVRIPRSILEKVYRKLFKHELKEFIRKNLSIPAIYDYRQAIKFALPDVKYNSRYIPCVIPNWDNTPRSGANGIVLQDSTPELFRIYLRKAIHQASQKAQEEKIIFIKSWNEWAEGNYLEPDQRFGKAYLEVVKSEIYH